MGFRVKVLPGVRVGVSSRGVRTSVGPRIASVHVGAGRTGFSTGLGPVSYGTTVGGGSGGYSRSSPSRSGGTYTSTYGPTPTQSAKADEARQIEARIQKLTKAHLEVFTPASRSIATPASTEPLKLLITRFRKTELSGVSFFDFSGRRTAKIRALELAQAEQQRQFDAAQAECDLRQAELDASWSRLMSNDSATVFEAMTAAFGDNEAKSAVLDVEGSEATVLVVIPELTVIPDRDWSITAAGNLSVKKMTAASRDSYYFDMVFSQIIATANEGFAVAPGITRMKIVLVRNKLAKQLNRTELECLGYGVIARERLRISPDQSQFGIVQAASNGWMESVDQKLRFKPVNLAHEPEIRKLIEQISEI